MPVQMTRRNIVFIIALLVLLGMLIYSVLGNFGVMLHAPGESDDLILTKAVQSDEATRTLFAERAAVIEKGIQAHAAVGDVDQDLYLALGSDANFLGDLAGAKWAYEELLQLNPINYIAWGNYAGILEDMGDFEAAEEAYWQALNLNVDAPSFQKYIGFLERHNEDGSRDDEIIGAYELGIQILGQETWNMVGLAEFYMDQGDCKRAVDHYEVALQLDPQNPAVQDDLASAREECRNQ